MITIETRRGTVEAILRADREVADGMVFMPFCFYESPANKLTNPMLDPYGKHPGVQVLRRTNCIGGEGRSCRMTRQAKLRCN